MNAQKRAWLSVACCLLLLTHEGLAQAWEIDRQIDPITDEKKVTASLRGHIVGTILDGLDIGGAAAAIKIVCDDIGSFFAFFTTEREVAYTDFNLSVNVVLPLLNLNAKTDPPESPLEVWSLTDRDVILRFDSEEPKTERWKSFETDYLGYADFVSPHQPYAFLERLATGVHHQLAVRSMHHNVTWTAVFDLSQSAPIAREVLTVCPESGWKKVVKTNNYPE